MKNLHDTVVPFLSLDPNKAEGANTLILPWICRAKPFVNLWCSFFGSTVLLYPKYGAFIVKRKLFEIYLNAYA